MTKLILLVHYISVCYFATSYVPVTWQAAVIFRHYFTLVVLHVQLFIKHDFTFLPKRRWKLHSSGLLCSE